MIHRQQNGFGDLAWYTQRFNWTAGCIAVTDKEMDEIWSLVKVNTPIIIEK
jgi:murein L,D-transpeptidase YafK